MKLNKINKSLICDTVLCNKLSSFQIETGSYKGNMFLCEDCFKNLSNIFKRSTKNEQN